MVRVGLIGYGGWARAALAPALAEDGRGRIVAACARTGASRERAKAELGPDVQVFADYRELLEGAEVDAVMVALPEHVHEEAMVAALEAGVAIYWEPPLADRPERIRPLVERLAAAGQVTHADLEFGYTPVVVRLGELVQQGAIGRLQAVRIVLNSNWGELTGPSLNVVHHLAPWYVDGLNTVVGRQPSRVLVLDGFGTAGPRQHFSTAHLDYDGAWGTIQLNIGSVETLSTRIEATGADGEIAVDFFAGTLASRTREKPEWETVAVPPRQPVMGEWPGEMESVAAFLDAVESGRPSRTNGRLLAQLHLVGLAAEESAASSSWAAIEKLD